MQDKIIYWLSVIFSAAALLLFVVNATLINGNRNLQADIGMRQGAINAASSLAPLNQNLAQALAEAALSKNDKDIKALLSSQGITLRDKDKNQDASKDQSTAKKK